MQLWLHSIEVFVDRCIPYLLILLAILIIGGIFFPANVASWTEKIEVFDGVVIGFFAVDLAFKYNRVRNIPNFIKKYWLDILATIPFFFVFRFFEGFLELADMLRWERGAEEAALIVHEGIATEKEVFRFVREVEEAGKASRYARMERFLKPLARFPRFLKVFPFFEK
ncbi:hypothetical protein HYS48_01855, partial [Candidatus Woesearchaeota archaeon]|nr:hypothetical protein [Candidatus Woesearchaeota archaeon]